MPKEDYFKAFPPKKGFGLSISQIKGCFLKVNAFCSSFGIMFRTFPSIFFIWQYCNYRPAMDMCSTEAKYREWSMRVSLNFQEFSSCSLSLKIQRDDKVLLFLIASEPLFTVILKGNKPEQVHSNHITNKRKTSQFHLINSDCSHYRNSHSETVPLFCGAVLWSLISPFCHCETLTLVY